MSSHPASALPRADDPRPSRPTRFYFLLVCWGAAFREYVCRFMIPSLLASGNLPALRNPAEAKLLIVTTRRDWLAFNRDPAFRRLRELVPVEAIWDEDRTDFVHKYRRMSNAHAILAEICFRDRAFAINLNPDSIYPSGCVAEAQRLAIDEGHDVVLCAAIRFDQTGIEEELERTGRARRGEPLELSMRDAVSLGLRHLHPESRASDWDAANFGRLHESHQRAYFLTCCLWRVAGEDGAFVITHNWSPFVVNYAVLARHDTSALDGRALDGAYIFENFARRTGAIHVVQDSDSLFLLGMTPRDEMAPPEQPAWFAGDGRLAEWTKGLVLSRTVNDPGIDEHRRKIYAEVVRWHAHDFNERWDGAEASVRRLIREYVAQNIEAPGVDDKPARRLWYRLCRNALS